MNTSVMLPNPYLLLAWITRVMASVLTSVLLMNIPADFYAQLASYFDVPEIVKVIIASLMGSASATGVEYLAEPSDAPRKKAWHWPLKIMIGWASGIYSGATSPTIAFLAGIAGYGAVVLLLANQKKKINSDDHVSP